MKKVTTLFLSLVSTALMAQNIPNPSFETWAGGKPTSWNSISYNIVAATVAQSATAHAGSLSVSLTSQQFAGNYYGGDIETGSALGQTYYLYTGGTNPVALSGWYQLTSNGGDYFDVVVSTKSGSSVTGGQTYTSSANTAVWKQFSDCITYGGNNNPVDSVSILIQLNASHAGSSALVDDLSFTACGLDVPTIDPTNVELEPAYPNPASTVCNIIYSIPTNGTVSADIYDISGRKLVNLLSNTKQTNGRYKLPVDVSGFANGIYIYRIVVDGQTYTQKFTVAK